MKTYKDRIEKLEPNQIFVFGSNTEGRHGKGSALFAKQYCGAVYGIPYGIQGQSYAIITKDLTKKVHPSITESYIISQIKTLYEYAIINKDKDFLIAYSNSINLNGYTSKEMAKMFSTFEIPDNIVFEEEFSKLL
jgi:hypothetical protein